MTADRKIRIGIDASCILPRGKTGVGYFTENLLREMAGMDEGVELRILLNSLRHKRSDLDFLRAPGVRLKQRRVPGPLLVKSWRRLHFPPVELFTGFVDVFHSATGYVPPQIRGKRIITVYDLFFMKRPDLCEKMGGVFFRESFPKLLPRMDRIITPTNAVKRNLLEYFDLPGEKITVIYGGVDRKKFREMPDEGLLESIRQEYRLPPHYILCVGALEPRKNLEGLLIAYQRLKEILYNPPRLALVGGDAWGAEALKRAIRRRKLSRDVILTGYVPEERLALLYNAALLYVMPSFSEGFGLPVLEAMACGTPCLVSKDPALEEVAGDAAMKIDPHNYYDMAERMKEVITSHQLRGDLSRRGLERSKRFSWRLTAKKTLRVYRETADL